MHLRLRRALLSPEEYLARTDLFAALAATALYLVVALSPHFLKIAPPGGRWTARAALANCLIGAVQFFKGQQFMPFPFLPRPGLRSAGQRVLRLSE
ncbi:MAG: hypothetical protein WDN28_28910 [Chthoniobacter sp.]